MAKVGEMNVRIGVECTDDMAAFCVDMLNIYLHAHAREKEIRIHNETPKDEVPYQRLTIEKPVCTTEERGEENGKRII